MYKNISSTTIAFFAIASSVMPLSVLAEDGVSASTGGEASQNAPRSAMGEARSTLRMGNASSSEPMRERVASSTKMERERVASSTDMIRGRAASTTTSLKEKIGAEIDRREQKIASTSERISKMSKLSEDQKQSGQSLLSDQMDNLESIKDRLANGEATTTLRESLKELSDTHKSFAHSLQTTAISATLDRIKATVTMMQSLADKFEKRIMLMSSDTSTYTTALTDARTKLTSVLATVSSAQTTLSTITADTATSTVESTIKTVRGQVTDAQKTLSSARADFSTLLEVTRTASSTDNQ